MDSGGKEGKTMHENFDAAIRLVALLIALVDLFLRLSDRRKKN